MKALVGGFVLLCWLLPGSAYAGDEGYFRLLNSYLALKLHLDDKPESGQIVGAAWLRIENRTGAKTNEIPILLNPGLRITGATGPGGRKLPFTQKQTAITDWPDLKLNAATITLPGKLKENGTFEITVNFEGWMKPLTDSGMGYVRETLSPDFTIFRLENFSYPVIATPSESAISAAGRLQSYYQSVSLEVPDGYRPAGNLRVENKTLKGDRVEYELKSDIPIPSLMLPIARYGQVKRDRIVVNFLNGRNANAERLADEAERAMALFTEWFGPAPGNRQLAITAIPEGLGSQRMPGLIIQDEAAFNNSEDFDEFYHEINHLWHPKEPALRPSRWNEGLAMLMQSLAQAELQAIDNVDTFKSERFSRVRQAFERNAENGSIALADYGDKGVTDLSYSVGAVFFAVLHDLMGEEAFLKLIADMQREFELRGADTGTFGTYLVERMPTAKAEEFVEGWFLRGTAGRDMADSADYQALVKKYQ